MAEGVPLHPSVARWNEWAAEQRGPYIPPAPRPSPRPEPRWSMKSMGPDHQHCNVTQLPVHSWDSIWDPEDDHGDGPLGVWWCRPIA